VHPAFPPHTDLSVNMAAVGAEWLLSSRGGVNTLHDTTCTITQATTAARPKQRHRALLAGAVYQHQGGADVTRPIQRDDGTRVKPVGTSADETARS
jgi:hypothetical protein